MQSPTDPQEVPSNATSSVCSDQAHDDDLSLHAVEWSDEDRECQGDCRLRVGKIQMIQMTRKEKFLKI